MAKEFKTRKAIENKPLIFNMPPTNALILITIIILSFFILISGFTLAKLVVIFSINLLSFIVLIIYNEKKIRAFRKKHFFDRIIIKINSYKPFR